MDEKLKTIKIVVAALIIFIVLLFAAMLINFVSLVKVNSRIKELEKKMADLSVLSTGYADDITYKETDEYIERYARELLNMKGQGEEAIVGKEP